MSIERRAESDDQWSEKIWIKTKDKRQKIKVTR